MTNQFYDVLMCFFSPSVKLLLQGARLPSVGPAHLSADLTGPLPGLQPASDDPFFSFFFFVLFICLFWLQPTKSHENKQMNITWPTCFGHGCSERRQIVLLCSMTNSPVYLYSKKTEDLLMPVIQPCTIKV